MAKAEKPSLDLLIEGDAGKKAANGESGMPGEDEDSESFDAAASELFDAIKSGDMEGFKTALRAVVESC